MVLLSILKASFIYCICQSPSLLETLVCGSFDSTIVTTGEKDEGRGDRGVEESEVQTIRYKISYKDILYNMGIQPVFCNNCKW
jgi:hypothetical protein